MVEVPSLKAFIARLGEGRTVTPAYPEARGLAVLFIPATTENENRRPPKLARAAEKIIVKTHELKKGDGTASVTELNVISNDFFD